MKTGAAMWSGAPGSGGMGNSNPSGFSGAGGRANPACFDPSCGNVIERILAASLINIVAY